ncbi:MAG: hypothetical protein E6R03_08455 [Hyphomicrobiaceae bacterium]|nr:MAG: hypothetical protein E6R03_08455 [Hyphomicrobiaceae bacterium]
MDLPWDTRTYLYEPPYPRPDTTDLERQELDGLTYMEAINASRAEYDTYCKARQIVTDISSKHYDSKAYLDPTDAGQKAQLLAHQARAASIFAAQGRIDKTPAIVAWRQAFDEARAAHERLSFKNWLRVGMVFETADGRQFLVGNMDVSGDEGGCCPTNSITNETRIVRYCILELPFNLTHE